MTDGRTTLTVPIVLGWNLKPLRDVVDILLRVGPEIEAEMVSAADRIGRSDDYFAGVGGEAARARGANDKTDGLATVDIYETLANKITPICNTFQAEMARMQIAAAETAASKWDLFYTDDGEVLSRKSNWETAKSHWVNPAAAIAAKELEQRVLTSMFREALANILEADADTAGIAGVLENLTDSVKLGMANIPTDPELARILLENQVNAEDTEIWPTGTILQTILAFDPTFEPEAMTKSEISTLEQLLLREGPRGPAALVDFYNIRNEAKQASEDSEFSKTLADGQGDAFRHTYWNALLTERFGADFAEQYATAHERVGGQQSHREAMDVFNNNLGRQLASAHPDATPDELKVMVTQAINDGKAVVIGRENVNATPHIAWSNQIPNRPDFAGLPTDLYVPLPGKK